MGEHFIAGGAPDCNACLLVELRGVSPVRIGACADADEGGNENGKGGESGDQKVVHTCLLVALAKTAALNPGGVVVVSSVRAVVRS